LAAALTVIIDTVRAPYFLQWRPIFERRERVIA
jgi:hypothetical protein